MELAVHEAFANARSPASRWPRRGGNNRLEPECWPEIRATFQIAPDVPIFTIGSCFARNIERHLANLGFDVAVVRGFRENTEAFGPDGWVTLNRYTPPSIHQELSWAGAIRDRDDQVRPADVESFCISMADGSVIDSARRNPGQKGISFEEALRVRRALYSVFRLAFDCPIIVMTLGLVESWYDRHHDRYVEFSPVLLEQPSRFSFRRLDYPECLAFTKQTIELLSARQATGILLTTSPVPLARTFTKDDVIVANAYSKSVLRAVTGKIVEMFENVDYFPSYESVVLTKRTEVWEDDLVHPQKDFVARIMSRVVSHYAPSLEAAKDILAERKMQFQGLVANGKLAEAGELYTLFAQSERDQGAPEFKTAEALYLLGTGDHLAANSLARNVLSRLKATNDQRHKLIYDCFSVLKRGGDLEGADEARDALKPLMTKIAIVSALLHRVVMSDAEVGLEMVCEVVSEHAYQDKSLGEMVANRIKSVARDLTSSGEVEKAAYAIRIADKYLSN